MVGYPGGTSYTVEVGGGGEPNVLPMTKKGIIAAMTSVPNRLYLDLIANPGFSGSPVVMPNAQLARQRSQAWSSRPPWCGGITPSSPWMRQASRSLCPPASS